MVLLFSLLHTVDVIVPGVCFIVPETAVMVDGCIGVGKVRFINQGCVRHLHGLQLPVVALESDRGSLLKEETGLASWRRRRVTTWLLLGANRFLFLEMVTGLC
jgi:hypothetical protein